VAVNAIRTEQEEPVFHPGAVTWISAEDLAAMTAAGGSTIGQPVPVANGHPVVDCPECNGEEAG
jgi:hypothetical protein